MNVAISEALRLTTATTATLLAAAPGPSSAATAQLSYLCGVLDATAAAQLTAGDPIEIASATYWASLTACFEQARVAGATYESMDALRLLVPTFNPIQTNLGAMISNYVMRLTLCEQVQILAAMTFTSRQQVDTYLGLILTSFGPAIDVAAGNMDQLVYISLISLQSACVSDLSARAAPLPSIVTADFPRPLPALLIAQTLYQDPSQVPSIVAMNDVSNPVFMPTSLTVLSNAG